MKTRAGCAWLKMNIAVQVKPTPNTYSPKLMQQSGSRKSYIDLGRYLLKMQLSTSYFSASDKYNPGTMISPNPSMLNLIQLLSAQGNSNLRGRSMFLATVTITSDWQTQYRSQKNSSQSVGSAILKDLRLAYFRAVIAKNSPNRLLISQCLLIMNNRHNKPTKAGQSKYLEPPSTHLQYFYCNYTPFANYFNESTKES